MDFHGITVAWIAGAAHLATDTNVLHTQSQE
jgi:hypothetical protein